MRILRPNTTYSIGRISRWIWDSSRDNRLQAILNTSIGLLDVVLALLSVWTVQRAIDIASHHLDGDVIMAVMWMALVISGTFVLDFCSTWVKNYYGVRAQNRMQRRMLGHILHSEFQGRNSMHSGDVINRLESDVNTVVNFVAETIPNAVSVFCLFVGAFVYLYSLDSRLAIIIVIMFPLFLLVSKIYVSRMRELSRDVRNSDSMVQSLLQESIQNRILVKTLEGEDTIIDKLSTQHDALHRKVIRRTKFSVFSSMLVSIGFASGYIVAFAWGALRLAAGTLTYGGMSAFLQLVNRVQRPARALTNLAPQFVSVFTAAERLMILEDVPLELKGTEGLLKSQVPEAEIIGTASTEGEYLKLMRTVTPDLVLMDLGLQGSTTIGVELCRNTKADHKDIKILVFTGELLNEKLWMDVLDAGADGIILKTGEMLTRTDIMNVMSGKRYVFNEPLMEQIVDIFRNSINGSIMKMEATISYDIDEYDERFLRHLALGYTKEQITTLKGMPFGVKSLEKRQAELVQKLFPEGHGDYGVNAVRLVTRAFQLHILDIDNLEPDEE